MFSRRTFLAGSLALTGTSIFGETPDSPFHGGRTVKNVSASDKINSLVPEIRATGADYFDTWHVQYYLASMKLAVHDLSAMVGSQGSKLARAELNEANLLGAGGLAGKCYPSIRGDLYFVLDDGWDVPPNGDASRAGSQELDLQRFPSFTGTPVERLTRLNLAFRQKGWRAAGLWIAAQMASGVVARDKQAGIDTESTAYTHDYWKTRLRWSEEAGIRYWKVDFGKEDKDSNFRPMLVNLGKQYAPKVTIEGAIPRSPLNGYNEPGSKRQDGGGARVSQDWLDKAIPLLNLQGTFRTYDTLSYLAVPTTLDRVAGLLRVGSSDSKAVAKLNCQDEAYIGAALGCDLGIMRHDLHGILDVSDPGPRHVARRLTEIIRAVRWHRIAPPTSVGAGSLSIDNEALWDNWKFSAGETWMTSIIGQDVKQGAPARVARGIPLPEVRAAGEPPYVIASKHANGSLAVATLGRMSAKDGWYEPLADVSIEGAETGRKVGIFGHYKSLEIRFDKPLAGRRVWAQDLASDKAADVTSEIAVDGPMLRLEGDLLDRIGLSENSQNDLSDPGLVLQIR